MQILIWSPEGVGGMLALLILVSTCFKVDLVIYYNFCFFGGGSIYLWTVIYGSFMLGKLFNIISPHFCFNVAL